MKQEKRNRNLYPGWIVFGSSLLAYLATMAPCPVPGRSARLIVVHSGLGPFPALTHPLWTWIAHLAKSFERFELALALNFLNALLAATVVFLVFDLVRGLKQNRSTLDKMNPLPAESAQLLAGCVAAGALAFSIPFWFLATRADYLMLDACLLLLSLRLLARFMRRPDSIALCGFAFVCGLGTTEYTAFVPLVPLVALFLIFLLWRHELVTVRRLVLLAVFYTLGLVPWFAFALQTQRAPGAEWLQLNSYFTTLWQVWRWEWLELRFGLPKLGWILLALVSLVPFIFVVVLRFGSRSWTTRFGSKLVNAIAVILALMIFFNTPLAPWRLIGSHHVIIPYLLIAAYTGYLAGFGFALLHRPVLIRNRSARIRPWLKRFYIPLVAIILLAAAALNLPLANGRPAVPLIQLTNHLLDEMGERRWFISNGLLDDLVVIAASDRQQAMHVVNSASASEQTYRAYLSHLLSEPRMKNNRDFSVNTALTEWLKERPDPCAEVIVFSVPGLWQAVRHPAVPDQLFYSGCNPPEPDVLMSKHQAFWKQYGNNFMRLAKRNSPFQPWYQGLLMQMSKIANDLGVWMETRMKPEFARAAYRQSIDFVPDNICALMNLSRLIGTTEPSEAQKLETQIKEIQNRASKIPPAMIRLIYGALSQDAGMKTQEKTPQLLSRNTVTHLQQGLMEFSNEEYEKAEISFRASLKEKPTSMGWNNLAWTLFTMGRYEEALQAVEEALKLNPDNTAAQDTKKQIEKQKPKG